MDISKVDTLRDALVEVRKAHRLVYSFQERMLSLAYFIGKSLGLGEPSGVKHFSDSIGEYRGRNELKIWNEMWAWDFVYSYLFEYFFGELDMDDGSIISFSLVQYADTGYFDSEIVDRLDIAHFADPKSSSSKILFVLEDIPKGKVSEFVDLDEIVLNKEYASSKHTESEVSGKKTRLLLYSIPLERFVDERSSIDALKEYLAFLKRKDIEIELE